MKLLNREPTEEMVKATGVSPHLATTIWQAMYNAVPEIRVDMEPVAWMHVSRHGTYFGKADNALRSETISLYSAEQVAALQAERDELLDFIKYAEVDSGVCCCGDSMENHPSGMNCGLICGTTRLLV